MKQDTPRPAPDKGAEKKTDRALDDRELEKVTGAGLESYVINQQYNREQSQNGN